MMMEVGTLVKEKEGPRFGGLVVESKKINDKRTDVKIQWADGSLNQYKNTTSVNIDPFQVEFEQYEFNFKDEIEW